MASCPGISGIRIMDREWWSYREIRFTREQILWILKHLVRERYWPGKGETSGYTDMPRIRKKGSTEAPFAKPAEIIAEIEIRLERAGLDGLILEAIESWDKSVESLSKQLHVSEETILKRRKRALWYVAGWRRKPNKRRK